MEKAILETLIYADIFDYPLKAWEIHKWLIRKKCELPDVEKGLRRLLKKKKIVVRKGYYVLSGRSGIIEKRINRVKPSEAYLRSARMILSLFKIIPWIRLVGISGNLAMENAERSDDIDLFVITQKNRLWLTRLGMLFILSVLEKRRRKRDTKVMAAGKFCLNLLVEEDQLEQERKDLYISHEVLQMRPLWERDKMYGKFLNGNSWAFEYLPNCLMSVPEDSQRSVSFKQSSRVIGWFEQLVRFMQLRYMGVPKSSERVSRMAVYFHPEDMQPKVLKEFAKRCKRIIR